MSIISPEGREITALGREGAPQTIIRGDIAACFDWLDIGNKDKDPCMVIVKNSTAIGAGYVIPWSAAWRYADSKTGAPSKALLDTAKGLAVELGFFPDRFVVTRICDLIVDSLPVLMKMPSDDPHEKPEGLPNDPIEATMKINGRVAAENLI
jgi:hypothetical protein